MTEFFNDMVDDIFVLMFRNTCFMFYWFYYRFFVGGSWLKKGSKDTTKYQSLLRYGTLTNIAIYSHPLANVTSYMKRENIFSHMGTFIT